MKKMSSTKIFTFIVIVIILANLSSIFKVFGIMLVWFGKSLNGLNQFPEGAQSAIAFLSVLLLVVMFFKLMQK